MSENRSTNKILQLSSEKKTVFFDENKLIITVPVEFANKNRRKVIMPRHPEDFTVSRDYTLIKAVARAFKWQEMFDAENLKSVSEISVSENIKGTSHISRHMRLTTLSPKIIGLILRGDQPKSLTLPRLLEPFPLLWKEQEKLFGV